MVSFSWCQPRAYREMHRVCTEYAQSMRRVCTEYALRDGYKARAEAMNSVHLQVGRAVRCQCDMQRALISFSHLGTAEAAVVAFGGALLSDWALCLCLPCFCVCVCRQDKHCAQQKVQHESTCFLTHSWSQLVCSDLLHCASSCRPLCFPPFRLRLSLPVVTPQRPRSIDGFQSLAALAGKDPTPVVVC